MPKFTNEGICQEFASGRTDGEGSNIFINEDKIYSYGYHFVMAKRINYNEFLYNSDTYSSTTNQHQSHLRSAIYRGSNCVWEVMDCEIKMIHEEIKGELERLESLIEKARGSLLHYVEESDNRLAYYVRFCERFKLRPHKRMLKRFGLVGIKLRAKKGDAKFQKILAKVIAKKFTE